MNKVIIITQLQYKQYQKIRHSCMHPNSKKKARIIIIVIRSIIKKNMTQTAL